MSKYDKMLECNRQSSAEKIDLAKKAIFEMLDDGEKITIPNTFFIYYPCIITSMIPLNLLAYDERSRWDRYCATLPCTKGQIVSATYLTALICDVFIIVFIGLFQVLGMLLAGKVDLTALGSILSMLTLLCMVSSAFPLPFIFRFGTEKGRMAYYFTVGIACSGSFLAADIVNPATAIHVPAGILFLIAIGVFALSWFLSVKLYEGRELN